MPVALTERRRHAATMVKAVLATKIGDWRETLQLTELPALPDVPPPVRTRFPRSLCSTIAMMHAPPR